MRWKQGVSSFREINRILENIPETRGMRLLQTSHGGRQPASQGRSTTPNGSLMGVGVPVVGPRCESSLLGPLGVERGWGLACGRRGGTRGDGRLPCSILWPLLTFGQSWSLQRWGSSHQAVLVSVGWNGPHLAVHFGRVTFCFVFTITYSAE